MTNFSSNLQRPQRDPTLDSLQRMNILVRHFLCYNSRGNLQRKPKQLADLYATPSITTGCSVCHPQPYNYLFCLPSSSLQVVVLFATSALEVVVLFVTSALQLSVLFAILVLTSSCSVCHLSLRSGCSVCHLSLTIICSVCHPRPYK